MRWQVLSSGSQGNALLVRAGDARVLLDCGLTGREMVQRLEAAKAPPPFAGAVHHVVLTHGHLDHTRSSGMIARASQATLHSTAEVARNRSLAGATARATFTPGVTFELQQPSAEEPLYILPAAIPHDARPTVALRVEHRERVAVLVTDMGCPDEVAVRPLRGAHLLQLEFNHDREMLFRGPYPPKLQRRVAGDEGHLSNEQASVVLRHLAGPELHTLVLAHLSATNNAPELAVAAATDTLASLGLSHVRVLVAEQDTVGENLTV